MSIDIVIDPGHGDDAAAGHSTPLGARGPGGALEKDVVLRLATRLAQELGARAALTRTDDTNLPLAARAAFARRQGARVFLSLHANSGTPGQRGAEVWVHQRANEASRKLAARVLAALSALPDAPPSLGVKPGMMAVLTPESLGPECAACLLEVDYVSDPAGEHRLTDDGAIVGIARALRSALLDHLDGAAERASAAARKAGASRAASALDAKVAGAAAGGTRRALVVGINDYSLQPGWHLLGGCVPDASSISALLQKKLQFAPGDVRVLLDRAATRNAILSALGDLMSASRSGDVLCFYFSGHGTYVDDPTSGTPGRFAQGLVPADGDPILDRELADLVTARLGDGVNFTVILDSCFSGGMGEVAGVPDTLRSRPLPPTMNVPDTAVTLLPVGLCAAPEADPSISGRITNAGLVCDRRPNTTVVPYARATLFSAVDFCELAGERDGHGDYTRALLGVLEAAAPGVTCEHVQQGVVEAVERLRQDGLADDYEHPMLRGQGSRMREGFLQPFSASEYGLSVRARERATKDQGKKPHAPERPAAPTSSKRPPPVTHDDARPHLAGATANGASRMNGYGLPHGRHELYDAD
jgi:N-acetylmuramoyl-L-alanine amidase